MGYFTIYNNRYINTDDAFITFRALYNIKQNIGFLFVGGIVKFNTLATSKKIFVIKGDLANARVRNTEIIASDSSYLDVLIVPNGDGTSSLQIGNGNVSAKSYFSGLLMISFV